MLCAFRMIIQCNTTQKLHFNQILYSPRKIAGKNRATVAILHKQQLVNISKIFLTLGLISTTMNKINKMPILVEYYLLVFVAHSAPILCKTINDICWNCTNTLFHGIEYFNKNIIIFISLDTFNEIVQILLNFENKHPQIENTRIL